jgi:oxygen-dependent protoporphyrinogen oxidase
MLYFMSFRSVAIVGGGISGLSTAYLLKQQRPDWRVTLLEQESSVGGNVRSSLHHGFTVDWGPPGFLTNVPETLELARSLGLADELREAAPAAKHRFLFTGGALKPLPLSPPAFLKSDLLSPPGKLRALLEPLLGGMHPHEETVYGFMARHFGHEVARVFSEPLVLGITSGKADETSLDALFPRMRALERSHGSLVRGMIQAQKQAKQEGKPTGRLTSFPGGMQRLADALQATLKDQIRAGTRVRALEQHRDRYDLHLQPGETLQAHAVVLATPAFVSADLIESFVPSAADLLRDISYADVHVFALGFDRIDVPNALNGFGFLVPRGEEVRSLGVLYSSSIFADHAPEGKVLLRVIAGGAADPAFHALSPEEMLRVVLRDLRVSLGIAAPPDMVQHIPRPRGIPQYALGHPARVRTIMASLPPGLHVVGNAYHGVGVNDCIRDARRVADTLLAEAPSAVVSASGG